MTTKSILLFAILFSVFSVENAVHLPQLEHLSFGVCRSFAPDLNLSIPEDLLVTPECGKCSDIYGDVLVGAPSCMEGPCDGLVCFEERYVLTEEGPNNPVDACVKGGYLDYTCNEACDSLCAPLCDLISQRYYEEEFVKCAYDLLPIGLTDTFVTGLCTGTVPPQFCDNAVAEDRTCFGAKIERGQEILDTGECAPVSYTGHKDSGRLREYWACPMDTKITGVVKIYEIRPEYCAILEKSYGEELITSVEDSEGEAGRLSSWIAQL